MYEELLGVILSILTIPSVYYQYNFEYFDDVGVISLIYFVLSLMILIIDSMFLVSMLIYFYQNLHYKYTIILHKIILILFICSVGFNIYWFYFNGYTLEKSFLKIDLMICCILFLLSCLHLLTLSGTKINNIINQKEDSEV